jgi:Transposase DDE domain.
MELLTDTYLSSLSTKDILDSIEVRPILPEEKTRWDELMKAHHYLGFRSLIGEGIRYVAVSGDYWLALLGWAAAALCCGPRDKWIGWSSKFREQRLFLVANNVRFLILPSIRIPNLASKVLSLNVKRLSKDWQERFNHPIVLAETFVDPRYFIGTCYQAAGWTYLGETKGFAKSAKKYIQHNQPKKTWIKPIHKSVNNLLTQPILPSNMRCSMQYKIPFPHECLDELRQLILGLPDFRTAAGKRHQLATLLSIVICATLCGARSYLAIAEWAARCSQSMLSRLRARYDKDTKAFIPPSEPTIRRVLQNINGQAVDDALTGWLMRVAQRDKNSLIAVDGKTLKGAKDSSGKQVQLLSAFLCNPGVVISQRKIDSKTNEIPEIKPLLAPLKIAGSIITADAMHTQTDTARFIVEEKIADYVFTVKDNQKELNKEIRALSLESFPP